MNQTKAKPKRMPVESTVECVTLKIPEAAQIAGCGVMAIRKRIGTGEIPHLRLGKNIIRIPRAAFLRWIESAGSEGR
jgi:excisionase family DNA binding protein